MSSTDTIEYQEEAENFAEVRQKLADKHQLDESRPDEPTVRTYPVVGTPTSPEDLEPGDDLQFTILVEGENEETVSVPWPEDTNDDSEPLIRLLESLDVPPRDITELESVPVYTDGDEYELIIPPDDFVFDSEFTYTTTDGGRLGGPEVKAIESPLKHLTVASGAIIGGIALLIGSFILLGISPSLEGPLTLGTVIRWSIYLVGGSLLGLGVSEFGLSILKKYKTQ